MLTWLPKHVVIMGTKFKIVLDPDLENDGECDLEKRTIHINALQDDVQAAETLLHEICHIYGWKLTGDSENPTEDQVVKMTTCLTDFATANKTVVRKIIKYLE